MHSVIIKADCAHIRWQMIKNYVESMLLDLRILQSFSAKYRFHYNPSLSQIASNIRKDESGGLYVCQTFEK